MRARRGKAIECEWCSTLGSETPTAPRCGDEHKGCPGGKGWSFYCNDGDTCTACHGQNPYFDGDEFLGDACKAQSSRTQTRAARG